MLTLLGDRQSPAALGPSNPYLSTSNGCPALLLIGRIQKRHSKCRLIAEQVLTRAHTLLHGPRRVVPIRHFPPTRGVIPPVLSAARSAIRVKAPMA